MAGKVCLVISSMGIVCVKYGITAESNCNDRLDARFGEALRVGSGHLDNGVMF
jgi:hypothetical protein